MDTEVRSIEVPVGCLCVEQREKDIIIYKAGQKVEFSVATCVILQNGEQTTAIREVEETDSPVGKGTWTRTERSRITNQRGASLSELVDKTEWELVTPVEAPQQQPAIASGSFLHGSARPVVGARHG